VTDIVFWNYMIKFVRDEENVKVGHFTYSGGKDWEKKATVSLFNHLIDFRTKKERRSVWIGHIYKCEVTKGLLGLPHLDIYYEADWKAWELKSLSSPDDWCYDVKRIMSEYQAIESFWEELTRKAKTRGKVTFLEALPLAKTLSEKAGILTTREEQLRYVEDVLGNLIEKGELDGVVSPEKAGFLSKTLLQTETLHRHYHVDFNQLAKQLLDKGLILKTIECPNCSGKVDFPREGNMIECSFCKKQIYATDVFERFRELLS